MPMPFASGTVTDNIAGVPPLAEKRCVSENGCRRDLARKSPRSPEVTARVAPVSRLLRVTATPDILAPDASFVVPEMEAVTWPVADCEIATRTNTGKIGRG